MEKVIILAPYFYPAFKAGGPIVTCTSLALCLSKTKCVTVITTDRDIDGTKVSFDRNDFSGHYIEYRASSRFFIPFLFLFELLKSRGRAAVSVNTIYDPLFSFFPLLVSLLFPKSRLVVSPRGQFFDAAMANKKRSKSFYMRAFKLALSFIRKRSVLHLTSEQEEKCVRALFGDRFAYSLIPNLPDFRIVKGMSDDFHQNRGGDSVREVLSVGRVSSIKNYELLIYVASQLKSLANFVIVGPVEDRKYHDRLLKLMKKLKVDNVTFVGEKNKEELISFYANADIYFHPALSENFCHSAVEAMLNALPVVISSGLPWAGVSNHGGRVVDPSDIDEALSSMSSLLSMTGCELRAIGDSCKKYIYDELKLESSSQAYLSLFSR